MQDDLSKDFDELNLAKPGDSGPPPKERISQPSKLRDVHVRLREDDRVNAHNRALFQALLDGEPPYNQSELNDANQPDTTNINFQGAEQKLERAKAPYYRLVNSGETLVEVPTTFGPEDERPEWEAIMGEEISVTIRESEEFPYEADLLVHKHVWEGVGIAHWQDDTDWRFRAAGMGQFFFPRQVAASESRQEIVTAEEGYGISELFRKIADVETADPEKGWNPAAVRMAIKKATSDEPPYDDWERLMSEVKNNDMFVGSRLPKVRVIHGFIKEFDGSVSHYIISEVPCCEEHGQERFLYKGRSVYRSMTEALVLFPYGAGTNTLIHGIRGLGYKVYPFEQQRNRSIGRLIDKGLMASSLMLQPSDETDLANVGLTYFGDLAVIPPGVTFPNVPPVDLQRSVIPAIELMDRLGADRTAGYSSENVFDGDQRKTKAEVMAHLEQSAELSGSALDFFYNPLDRLLQQVVRRMSRKGYLPIEPGGEAIRDLRHRLLKRGVPLEAFYRIDWKRVKAVRVIGAGSAAARTVGLQRMEALRPRMDDVGQQILDRENAIDAVGVAAANRFFPRDARFRTTADTSIAILQNAQLMQGVPIPVLPSEKHMAHAREHMKPMLEAYPLVAEGQMQEVEFAQQFATLFSHTVEHVSALEGDIAAVEEAAAMREMLQRFEEYISNGMKELAAMEEEAAMEEQQAAQGGGDPANSPEAMERFARAQAEIQIMQAKAETDRQIKIDNAALDRSIKDAATAAEIRRKNMAASVAPAATKRAPAKKAARKQAKSDNS